MSVPLSAASNLPIFRSVAPDRLPLLGKLGETVAARGQMPPFLGALLPNLVVAALGVALTVRLLRNGVGKPR